MRSLFQPQLCIYIQTESHINDRQTSSVFLLYCSLRSLFNLYIIQRFGHLYHSEQTPPTKPQRPSQGSNFTKSHEG